MAKWWLRVDFDEQVSHLPKVQQHLLIYALVLCVAYADHSLGYEFGFSIFYSLPLIIATRNLGRNAGLFLSLVCAILWSVMDRFHGLTYVSSLASYWQVVIKVTLFAITVLIFDGWEKEKENARTDVLTTLANRLAFKEFGEAEIKRCRRYSRLFSVVYIDVDSFKVINDRFGHKAGDRLLMMIAEALKKSFRETDLVARLGGDEFSIILSETDAQGARIALDRVCDILNKIPRVGSLVTLSIGLVTFKKTPSTFDEAVKKADDLMYVAKSKGKNCIESTVVDGSD